MGGQPGVTDVMVPNDRVGLVIGRGGETIKYIQSASGCHVQVQKEHEMLPGQVQRKVTLKGSPEQVALATQIIKEKTAPFAGNFSEGAGVQSQFGNVTLEVKIPDDRVGTVIGRAGATIKMIQTKNRVNVQIPKVAD